MKQKMRNSIEDNLKRNIVSIPKAVLITKRLSYLDRIVFGIIFTREITEKMEYLSVYEIVNRIKSSSRSRVRKSLNKLKTLGLVSERKLKVGNITVSDFYPLYPSWLLEEWRKLLDEENDSTILRSFKPKRPIRVLS